MAVLMKKGVDMAQNEAVLAKTTKSHFVVELMIACMGGCFLALMSQATIPLSITPIPVTLQTLAVFLLGGILGSRRAVYSVLAYLVQGCCCLPVFAGGVANPLWILGPQAGFLLSFIAAAFLIGKWVESKPRGNILYMLFTLTMGQLVIFAIGMAWLSFYVGASNAFMLGVLPFLSGSGLKIMAGSMAIRFYKAARG
jgi:biotin transport system substrate-specific component